MTHCNRQQAGSHKGLAVYLRHLQNQEDTVATFAHSVGAQTYRFASLKEVMAKASPARSGDFLAGVAALNDGERVAAQMALADIPLTHFLQEVLIPL